MRVDLTTVRTLVLSLALYLDKHQCRCSLLVLILCLRFICLIIIICVSTDIPQHTSWTSAPEYIYSNLTQCAQWRAEWYCSDPVFPNYLSCTLNEDKQNCYSLLWEEPISASSQASLKLSRHIHTRRPWLHICGSPLHADWKSLDLILAYLTKNYYGSLYVHISCLTKTSVSVSV